MDNAKKGQGRLSGDPAAVRRVEITTRSGSVYRVGRGTHGWWWMAADNVPNPASVALDPDDRWEIRRPEPWPPELGERIWLMPPEELDCDDPRRMPGGGKRTSFVRALRWPAAGANR